MQKIDWDSLPHGGDLFGEIQLSEIEPESKGKLWPGLALCAAGAGAAAWLSDHYGFPIILLGLLVGLSLNFVSRDPATHKGLDFAGRTFLRFGIVILGLQVTVAQVVELGAGAFAALLIVMLVTICAGMAGAKIAGQSRYAGLLAGGSTAICGASAALALYGVIGKERLSQAQFALTLVIVSLASAFAMSVYPILAGEFGLSARAAGFLTGASIHDVAQAIGGGYAFSNEAGIYATIVKLARVAMLAPLIALAGWFLNSGTGKTSLIGRLSLPWFIVAFFGVMILNSFVAAPAGLKEIALLASKALLLIAVTATAMRSRMDLLLDLGWRSTVPVIMASIASFLTALCLAAVFL